MENVKLQNTVEEIQEYSPQKIGKVIMKECKEAAFHNWNSFQPRASQVLS
jgi:hypothetical protein